MKTFKTITYIFTAASLLLCAATSKAAVGTLTNFSKVTIAMTITTNGTATVKGSTTITPVGSVKLSNSTLLGLFANWSGTSLPTGAQWVIDWDLDTPVLAIADKTGTNILLFVDRSHTVTNGTITAFFDIRFFDAAGPIKDSESATSDSYTETFTGDFELFFNDSSIGGSTWDLFSDGPDSEKFSASVSKGKDSWSDTESFGFNSSGGDSLGDLMNYNGTSDVQVSGTIKTSGKGNNFDSFLGF